MGWLKDSACVCICAYVCVGFASVVTVPDVPCLVACARYLWYIGIHLLCDVIAWAEALNSPSDSFTLFSSIAFSKLRQEYVARVF